MERQGVIHEDGAAGDQTKRWIYENKAIGDRGILNVFISNLVFCFICLFVISIYILLLDAYKFVFSKIKIKN